MSDKQKYCCNDFKFCVEETDCIRKSFNTKDYVGFYELYQLDSWPVIELYFAGKDVVSGLSNVERKMESISDKNITHKRIKFCMFCGIDLDSIHIE